MTPSESLQNRAARLIAQIVAMLDETYMSRLIDGPLDAAGEQFRCPADTARSHRHFNRLLAAFVMHLYRHGLACPRRLSAAQAREQALALLEQGYEGRPGKRYEAALLDAAQGGMPMVLLQLTQIIKNRQRQEYVRWVFARLLDPIDWDLRCAVARILMSAWVGLVPPPALVGGLTPEEMADQIPELLEVALESDRLGLGSAIPRVNLK
ncbi:MAG: hypothetical protein ABSH20_22875 [Tepidisphaeraceae bacterium]|jgi:hypothetical protein